MGRSAYLQGLLDNAAYTVNPERDHAVMQFRFYEKGETIMVSIGSGSCEPAYLIKSTPSELQVILQNDERKPKPNLLF
jgi:hypothetical protein